MDVGAVLDSNVGTGWCPHLAILVPDPRDVIPALASFYGLGARRNGWLFHRSLPGNAEADRTALTAAGLDVAALEAAERLVVAEPPPETDPERWARDAGCRCSRRRWSAASTRPGSRASRSARVRSTSRRHSPSIGAFHGRPAVSLCVYIVDDVGEAAREHRVASLAPFHDGIVVRGGSGAEVIPTR